MRKELNFMLLDQFWLHTQDEVLFDPDGANIAVQPPAY